MTLTAEDQKLIAAYRQGDEAAATELLEKYYVRLLELIRRQLGWKLREFGRFGRRGTIGIPQLLFASAQNRVQIAPDNSLWPLLVTIALNKVRNLGKYWQRKSAILTGKFDWRGRMIRWKMVRRRKMSRRLKS